MRTTRQRLGVRWLAAALKRHMTGLEIGQIARHRKKIVGGRIKRILIRQALFDCHAPFKTKQLRDHLRGNRRP